MYYLQLLLYAFGLIIIYAYVVFKWKIYNHCKSVINTETGKPVPVLYPTFPIGSDIRYYTYRIHELLSKTNEKLGKVWLYFYVTKPILIVSDAFLTKSILHLNSADFDKAYFNEGLTKVFGKSNLFVSDGEE